MPVISKPNDRASRGQVLMVLDGMSTLEACISGLFSGLTPVSLADEMKRMEKNLPHSIDMRMSYKELCLRMQKEMTRMVSDINRLVAVLDSSNN